MCLPFSLSLGSNLPEIILKCQNWRILGEEAYGKRVSLGITNQAFLTRKGWHNGSMSYFQSLTEVAGSNLAEILLEIQQSKILNYFD